MPQALLRVEEVELRLVVGWPADDEVVGARDRRPLVAELPVVDEFAQLARHLPQGHTEARVLLPAGHQHGLEPADALVNVEQLGSVVSHRAPFRPILRSFRQMHLRAIEIRAGEHDAHAQGIGRITFSDLVNDL